MSLKRTLCLLWAMLLLLSAAGCGGAPAANQADTDAVHSAMDKLHASTSFSVVQLTECEETITTDGSPQLYRTSNRVEISIITGEEPRMMTSTDVTVSMGSDSFSQDSFTCVVPEDGGYTEYYNDGFEWYKVSAEGAGVLSVLDASAFTGSFYADGIGFSKAGEDSLDSGKALRYEGALVGEDLLTMLESTGYLANISAMSERQQAKVRENLLRDLDEVIVTVWVDEASGYPVRFEASISEVLMDAEKSINKTLGNKDADAQWKVSEFVISMSFTDINSISEILPPPEAASAKPYEG